MNCRSFSHNPRKRGKSHHCVYKQLHPSQIELIKISLISNAHSTFVRQRESMHSLFCLEIRDRLVAKFVYVNESTC